MNERTSDRHQGWSLPEIENNDKNKDVHIRAVRVKVKK